MDKNLQKQLKKKLEAEKLRLTKDLRSFAKKDPKMKGNWFTRFPFFGTNRSHKDEGAEKIEEYEKLLPIEHNLELRLKDINKALEEIKKGVYGKCKNCNGKINIERLKAFPEARICMKCSRRK